MPNAPQVQFRANGAAGQALTDRTTHLDTGYPGPALAETARAILGAWDTVMRAELATLTLEPDHVDQLLDVMRGVIIDAAFWADPRSCLLGEIEDCEDDATGKCAYPELLDAARQWTPTQCAALLDAIVRLRARTDANPDESRAKALRAVGLRGER